MNVLVTGATGFIGLHVVEALERSGHRVFPVVRSTAPDLLEEYVSESNVVVHLAGVNRPKDPSEFKVGNADFTETLCQLLRKKKSSAKVIAQMS